MYEWNITLAHQIRHTSSSSSISSVFHDNGCAAGRGNKTGRALETHDVAFDIIQYIHRRGVGELSGIVCSAKATLHCTPIACE
jgi:hypothetical protein